MYMIFPPAHDDHRATRLVCSISENGKHLGSQLVVPQPRTTLFGRKNDVKANLNQ
jgi:hypothetical protein